MRQIILIFLFISVLTSCTTQVNEEYRWTKFKVSIDDEQIESDSNHPTLRITYVLNGDTIKSISQADSVITPMYDSTITYLKVNILNKYRTEFYNDMAKGY